MKKSVKTTKTLTPAKKIAKPVVAKTPAAPAVKTVEPKAVATTIIANFDVGFGRSLYVRGQGPGLSWDQGVLMECVAPDQWKVTLPGESVRPILFKVLIDDAIWSIDSDFSVVCGETIAVTPTF